MEFEQMVNAMEFKLQPKVFVEYSSTLRARLGLLGLFWDHLGMFRLVLGLFRLILAFGLLPARGSWSYYRHHS